MPSKYDHIAAVHSWMPFAFHCNVHIMIQFVVRPVENFVPIRHHLALPATSDAQ
jgi:hypothetical protein